MQIYIWRKVLAIVIVFFLIIISVFPSTAIEKLKENTSPISYNGNTLYVGGSGPNNYTEIQEAINNASDFDIVFVYNGHYNESLIVDKSIHLIGEDKNTTIIDGRSPSASSVIDIQSEYVYISGFNTIKGKGIGVNSDFSIISDNIIGPHSDYCGISIGETGNIIKDNIITLNDDGIDLNGHANFILNNTISSNGGVGIYVFEPANYIIGNNISNHHNFGILVAGNNNEFSSNKITGSRTGIYFYGGSNNMVFDNTISHDITFGIQIPPDAANNIISNNIISHTSTGIDMINYPLIYLDRPNNVIRYNNIHNNSLGISMSYNKNMIVNNNFMDNGIHADFYGGIFNYWIGNYWGEPLEEPYVIHGRIGLLIKLFPWIQFDRNPAQEPYDIEV